MLITRPLPLAEQTASAVAARGYDVWLAPMLVIETRHWARLPSGVQAILVTSANALPALSGFDPGIKLFAVGDASARRAAAMGFCQVVSAGRDAATLAELVAARLDPRDGALLVPSAVGQTLELAADLRARGFRVLRRVAYRARPAGALPEASRVALASGAVSHAMFFSTETALSFVRCISGGVSGLAGVEALAISERAARALAGLPFARIRVASHPNQDEMVALLP